MTIGQQKKDTMRDVYWVSQNTVPLLLCNNLVYIAKAEKYSCPNSQFISCLYFYSGDPEIQSREGLALFYSMHWRLNFFNDERLVQRNMIQRSTLLKEILNYCRALLVISSLFSIRCLYICFLSLWNLTWSYNSLALMKHVNGAHYILLPCFRIRSF